MKTQPIEYNEYSMEELLKMKHSEAIEGLSEQQQRFCEAYVSSHNIKTAAVKAGLDGGTCHGYAMRKRPRCRRYIQWLKARIINNAMVKGEEIIDEWIRIAFADITDFVDISRYSAAVKPASQIDGQLVKSIKTTRDGVSIELYDKLKALDSLALYTGDMPKDYKRIIDERKLEIMEEELEMKKKLYDLDGDNREDDGLIEALSKSAKVVWESENNSLQS